jgi:hypothetical protein
MISSAFVRSVGVTLSLLGKFRQRLLGLAARSDTVVSTKEYLDSA